jgi:hypothetical protein
VMTWIKRQGSIGCSIGHINVIRSFKSSKTIAKTDEQTGELLVMSQM